MPAIQAPVSRFLRARVVAVGCMRSQASPGASGGELYRDAIQERTARAHKLLKVAVCERPNVMTSQRSGASAGTRKTDVRTEGCLYARGGCAGTIVRNMLCCAVHSRPRACVFKSGDGRREYDRGKASSRPSAPQPVWLSSSCGRSCGWLKGPAVVRATVKDMGTRDVRKSFRQNVVDKV